MAEGKQGFCHGLKKDIEHDLFIAHNDRIEIMREGEYRMEIDDGEDLCFASPKPSFPWYILALGAVAVAA
jgi:hypothetical protein